MREALAPGMADSIKAVRTAMKADFGMCHVGMVAYSLKVGCVKAASS